MPQKTSAGVLLYRLGGREPEVLLVHPGGPFWAKKDVGAWFIVKGEIDAGEEPLATAKREFAEELGMPPPSSEYVELGSVKHRSGKVVLAWAAEGDIDVRAVKSNLFTLEWPPRSGKSAQFPEVDRAQFFSFAEAARRILPAERELLVRLCTLLTARGVECSVDDATD